MLYSVVVPGASAKDWRYQVDAVEPRLLERLQQLTGDLDARPPTFEIALDPLGHRAEPDAVVHRMREEEAQHGANAKNAGAAELPSSIQRLMRVTAKIMTRTAYWL